jgi:hypothetical protein
MPACNKSCLPHQPNHFDIKYHMAGYILISKWDRVIIIELKYGEDVPQLLLNGIPPKSSPRSPINI